MLCTSLSIFAIGDKLEHMEDKYTNVYGIPKATIELVMASYVLFHAGLLAC